MKVVGVSGSRVVNLEVVNGDDGKKKKAKRRKGSRDVREEGGWWLMEKRRVGVGSGRKLLLACALSSSEIEVNVAVSKVRTLRVTAHAALFRRLDSHQRTADCPIFIILT
jgi:hypothetical protein